jgi:hypothetical protein
MLSFLSLARNSPGHSKVRGQPMAKFAEVDQFAATYLVD